MTGDRCLNDMIHDGKRDGWDMLLAESEAVRKAISYQDTCVPLHPHSMVEKMKGNLEKQTKHSSTVVEFLWTHPLAKQ